MNRYLNWGWNVFSAPRSADPTALNCCFNPLKYTTQFDSISNTVKQLE